MGLDPACIIYGLAISLSSLAAVLVMGRIGKRQREQIRRMQTGMNHLCVAASNMWDALTPEQIRTLHPATVAVGNGVPPWDSIYTMVQEVLEDQPEQPNQRNP